jgi:hypothetical protein
MVRSGIRKPPGTTLRQTPSFKSLGRNSDCEIARRYRGGGECVPSGAARSIKKDRQFLAKSAGDRYCFSEGRLARLALPSGEARPGLWPQGAKWLVEKVTPTTSSFEAPRSGLEERSGRRNKHSCCPGGSDFLRDARFADSLTHEVLAGFNSTSTPKGTHNGSEMAPQAIEIAQNGLSYW